MGPRRRFVFLLAGSAIALLVCPPAAAERGALTLETGLGAAKLWTVYSLPGPGGDPEPQAFGTEAGAPLARLALRYAPSHDLELGLRLEVHLPVRVTHPDVDLRVPEVAEPYRGDLTYEVRAAAVSATGRLFFLGYGWRAFVDLGAGFAHLALAGADHVEAATQRSWALTLPDALRSGPFVEAGPGILHAGDRLAFGARTVLSRVLSAEGAWRLSADLFVSWSFYP